VNFPEAKNKTPNFLQTPFFEFEFLGWRFAFIGANLENNTFDKIDI